MRQPALWCHGVSAISTQLLLERAPSPCARPLGWASGERSARRTLELLVLTIFSAQGLSVPALDRPDTKSELQLVPAQSAPLETADLGGDCCGCGRCARAYRARPVWRVPFDAAVDVRRQEGQAGRELRALACPPPTSRSPKSASSATRRFRPRRSSTSCKRASAGRSIRRSCSATSASWPSRGWFVDVQPTYEQAANGPRRDLQSRRAAGRSATSSTWATKASAQESSPRKPTSKSAGRSIRTPSKKPVARSSRCTSRNGYNNAQVTHPRRRQADRPRRRVRHQRRHAAEDLEGRIRRQRVRQRRRRSRRKIESKPPMMIHLQRLRRSRADRRRRRTSSPPYYRSFGFFQAKIGRRLDVQRERTSGSRCGS